MTEYHQTVFNTIKTSVLESDEDVLKIKEIGMELYRQFIDKRKTETDISVWDTLPKRKMQNLKSMKLKDERNLMTKFLLLL